MAELQETRAGAVKIIAEKLKKSPDSILDTYTLQDLGADSLDLVEIIMNLEEHFVIHIEDEDAEKLHTVGDVVEYINRIRSKQ